MKRDEVDRLVEDISNAIHSSSLLSLLRPRPESHSSSLSSSFEQHNQYQYIHEADKRRSSLRKNRKNSKNPPPKCLSEIPKSILDKRVQPIRKALERIDAQKLLDLEIFREDHSSQERFATGPLVKDGVYCRPISDQIRPELSIDDDVSMDGGEEKANENNRKSSVVRYLHIDEVEDEYTIGIFVFGPHEKIPLHDHPEMCVLSRVLYGDLRRLSLDLDRGGRTPSDGTFRLGTDNGDSIENQTHSETNGSTFSPHSWLSRSATWLRTSGSNIIHSNLYNSGSTMDNDHKHQNNLYNKKDFPEGTKVAYKNAVDVLRAPEVAALYPYEGNLHEFVAGPHGAAVLDVLLPPYDDGHKRDCTFYNIREFPATPKAASSSNGSEGGHREPCLIIPTGQPENFHCISGRYKDLGSDDSHEDDYDDDYDDDYYFDD